MKSKRLLQVFTSETIDNSESYTSFGYRFNSLSIALISYVI